MEKTEMKAFTTKALVVAIVIFVVVTIWYAGGGAFHNSFWLIIKGGEWPAWNNLDTGNFLYYGTVLFFGTMTAIILIISLVNMLSKEPLFSKQEVALITLVLPISLLILTIGADRRRSLVNIITLPLSIYTRNQDTSIYYPFLSSLLGPQDTAVFDAMLPAGAAINFAAWLPSISWVIVFSLGAIFTTFFAGLLVQGVWIDYERLLFPLATLHNEMIELTQKSETGKSKLLNKYLLIGLLVGLVWLVPTHLQHWWVRPQWQPLVGLLWPDGPYGVLYWAGGRQIEQILPWSTLWINLMPYAIGWGFLNTIPNLVGAVAAGIIVFLIVPLVMYNMGLLTSPARHSASPRIQLNQWIRGQQGFGGAGVIPVGALLMLGMIAGVSVYTLWQYRRKYAIPLLALFKKPSPEAEKNSPLSYQLIWIGLIVSFIVWLASAVGVNIPITTWLVYSILITVVSIGLVRLLSETGGYFGAITPNNSLQICLFTVIGTSVIAWTGAWGEVTAATVAAAIFITMVNVIRPAVIWWALRGGWLSTHIFKVASDQKLDLKKTLMFVVALIIACVVIGFLFSLGLAHYLPLSIPSATTYQNVLTMGANHVRNAINRAVPNGGWTDPETIRAAVTDPAAIPYTLLPLLIGFAVIVVAYFMRGRFSWFIIGPAGIAIGGIMGASIWSSWLVALVIKYLVIKVGGMKLHNEKALPFFIGSLLAYFLVIFFGDLGTMLVNPGYWL